jgi:tRNA pseudouridine38-40 synthase
VLEGRDRTLGAPTAPAAGLYLVRVRYPAVFALPVPPLHEVSSPDRL